MKEMKAPEKVTRKMTRDGTVSENHVTGERTSISRRELQHKLTQSVHESIRVDGIPKQRRRNRSRKPRYEAERDSPAQPLRPYPLAQRLHMGSTDSEEDTDNVGVEAGREGVDQMRTASAAAQRRQIKRCYASRWRQTAAEGQADGWESAAARAKRAVRKTITYVKKHGKALLIVGIAAAMAMVLLGGVYSAFIAAGGGVSGMLASSYLSDDADMLAAEEAYCGMENELQEYLDSYESSHDCDEYHYDLDEIEHDPYVLISILSALHGGSFTIDEVQTELQMLFEKQYTLTETVKVETRYRTEVQTDEEGNEQTVEVAYEYAIGTVTLENFDLSHVPVYIMGEETLSLYAAYMTTLGNRSDLFPAYAGRYTTALPNYDIPASALKDETFAALIAEAEKYIGYPYVWGGSSPATSFDCSGFVSWVLTASGVCNTGRLGAQGLYNISTPVSSANARPGDLIFFVGTYDTPGVSHVGIYVGDGMMLHCGNPIQYTSINTSYWQAHFYAFARPPYD